VFADASALPVLGVVAIFVVIASFFSIRRLTRAVGASVVVTDTPPPGADVLKCGFDLRRPDRLSASLGLCTVRVSDEHLDVRTPVGDYCWLKGEATVSPLRRRIVGSSVRVEAQHATADVIVRDASALAAALARHGWQ
jgi:hypothetical protein